MHWCLLTKNMLMRMSGWVVFYSQHAWYIEWSRKRCYKQREKCKILVAQLVLYDNYQQNKKYEYVYRLHI
jgi:hypothetical protein